MWSQQEISEAQMGMERKKISDGTMKLGCQRELGKCARQAEAKTQSLSKNRCFGTPNL